MRLAAQAKAGFYPAPEQAVAHAARFLIPPKRLSWSLLDPCAGQGAALRQLQDVLRCPPSLVFAVEIDSGRSADCRAALPEGQVVGPASFFGVASNLNSFSAIWLNPPFDQSYGGGRVETRFLSRATELLMPGGIMMLVCPEEQVTDYYGGIRTDMQRWYDKISVVPFPEEARPYGEVVIFGVKLNKPRQDYSTALWVKIQAPPGTRYKIPPGTGPKRFEKVEPTEEEVCEMLAASPLKSRFEIRDPRNIPAPPLALGMGHVSVLLAAGQLDGVVEANGHSHVVRGSARKQDYLASTSVTLDSKGNEITKQVYSQRINLVVKTVGLSGVVKTYHSAPEEPEEEPEE